MPIRYKLDILEALKQAGYSTYRLRKEKILGERVISSCGTVKSYHGKRLKQSAAS